jgi:hypothetical protein
MGGCLGPEPPGVTNTYQNPVNPPGSPTWNNQQFPNYGYPSTPSTPHQNLKPYLSPVLPKSLVIPSSNLYLINQIRMVPHEFIEIKVHKNLLRCQTTSINGHNFIGSSNPLTASLRR